MPTNTFRRTTRHLLCAAAVALAAAPLSAAAAEIGAPDASHREAGPKDFLIDSPLYENSGGPLTKWLNGNNPDAGPGIGDSGIIVGGHVQGGYTYNPQRSSDDVIWGRVFDDNYGNAPVLDQVSLSVLRRAARDRFDVGGRVEVLYGYDTFRFHANGLDAYGGNCSDEDDSGLNPEGAAHHPRNQFDLTQAYLDINFEVGTGLLVRGGKFVSPLGYETIDPTTTPFYSRSYLFGFATPYTLTGVMLNYRLDPQWEVWGGVVRGWEQALNDNNDSVSIVARVDYRPDDRWNFRLGTIFGREGADCDCGCDGEDAARVLIDGIVTYKLSDQLGLGLEAVWGRSGAGDESGGSAEWYGVAGYASYMVSPIVNVNGRLEWFHDGDGTRLQTGSTIEVASATVGLTITPFPSHKQLVGLKIQPEVRYDHATSPEFDGGSRENQVTFGIGVMYAF